MVTAGRVMVTAGRVMVTAGRVMVTAGRVMVTYTPNDGGPNLLVCTRLIN